jgi:hypothetical protein
MNSSTQRIRREEMRLSSFNIFGVSVRGIVHQPRLPCLRLTPRGTGEELWRGAGESRPISSETAVARGVHCECVTSWRRCARSFEVDRIGIPQSLWPAGRQRRGTFDSPAIRELVDKLWILIKLCSGPVASPSSPDARHAAYTPSPGYLNAFAGRCS